MAETVTTESGGEVTFVQGQAVEQTTGGNEPEGQHGDELAAAKAAVKKALQEEGKKAAKETEEHLDKDPVHKAAKTAAAAERGPDGKFLPRQEEGSRGTPAVSPKQGKPAVEKALSSPESRSEDGEPQEAGSALKKALAERKEVAKYKADLQQEMQKAQAEVRQMHQQLQQQRKELEDERQRMDMLKRDPVQAIKANGWDPESFILDIANEGTPEGQMRRQQRELQAQLKEMQDWKRQQAERAQQQAQQYEQNQRKAYRQQVEKHFLGEVFEGKRSDGSEKHPHLAGLYKGHEAGLLAEGDAIAQQYYEATGQHATFEDIAEYLEDRTARWYRDMYGRAAQPSPGAQVAPQSQGSQPTAGIPGKRTLSPNSSGERRSLGTTLKDLDGDERREAAMEAVKAAIAAAT